MSIVQVVGPALLFCPADRPDRYAKALAAADTVILDLEDGVAAADKAAARAALVENPLDPLRTIVRINPVGSSEHALDRSALESTEYQTVMLAKTESPEQVRSLGGWSVVALCETALAVIRAPEIAGAEGLAGLMWGAEDLLVSTGGSSSRKPDGSYRDVARHARSAVLLAAAAHGVLAIDSVYVGIHDLDGLRTESEDAVASGFSHKACIHPTQAQVIRDAFRPSEADIDWACRVLAAAVDAPGVFSFEGRMIDEPLLAQARSIAASAPPRTAS
jgi:citrate lyase subunit beta / citryl-CoA lyase